MNADIYQSVREALHRLLALLEDPQPGLSTWQSAVQSARAALLTELVDDGGSSEALQAQHQRPRLTVVAATDIIYRVMSDNQRGLLEKRGNIGVGVLLPDASDVFLEIERRMKEAAA